MTMQQPVADKWEEIKNKSHPLKDARWVKCVAHIRRNETGEVRRREVMEVLHNGGKHPSTFNWEHNNYSCDCNRELFFGNINGVDGDDDPVCSKGRFSVNLENPVTGEIYYREFFEPCNQ